MSRRTEGRRRDGLLAAWGEWRPNTAPYVLHADRAALNSPRSAGAFVVFKSWRKAYKAPDFPPRDSRLHLGLLPDPYVGNLRRASIYVLGLNPGVGPHDYYGQYEVPAFRRALLANLKQKFGPRRLPFLFLDPQFSWHGGFEWWHGKLAAVIERLAEGWGVPFASARARLARELASLELVPYHSKMFSDPGGRLQDLPSAALAQAFAREFVLPRVEGARPSPLSCGMPGSGGCRGTPGSSATLPCRPARRTSRRRAPEGAPFSDISCGCSWRPVNLGVVTC